MWVILLAGCASKPVTPPASPDPLLELTKTMGDLEPAAHVVALAWDPGVELRVIYGLEQTQEGIDERHLQNTSQGYSLGLQADPRIGDGRARAWAYEYSSPGKPNTSIVVIVGANGSTLETFEPGANFSLPASVPFETGPIDSDDAALVAQTNQTWRELSARSGTESVMILSTIAAPPLTADGTAYWRFVLTTPDRHYVDLTIHAETGALARADSG